ncbi:AbrB/MazE/SpoVT family DNA-binding domain-containing protein [Candidatus Fukatsuia symbiotica]|uniref:Transcriptional regulator n=1 Tax=Candidatus Fukatsuia symbiotica TaxID=1878942 RepID=A0A2U8IBB9_9GAMM|nr:AbrB/MazE/SpoVT family DNA-binding domain-containing protein [Candidatus Fukatsuia symbiotica]AWK15654.1 transcriptional regulator [Candidatus Fukatsuia symbiotica]MEA9446178.1 AbrB/MazE/SpoVT family DNA-binding domain-containing protein [Candidatus Fukatsuia symbiotica]
MTTLTVTAKGQVTFKQTLLRHLGIKPGQKINVNTLPGGRAVIQAVREGRNIEDAFGILRAKNKGNVVLSIDDMNEIARKGWASEK